jgi:two-component system chemotaxis response regulator CheY
MKILIIDDNPDILEILSVQLESLYPKAMIAKASDGMEGMVQCRSEKFDLICTDWHMPHVNGEKLLVTLRHESSPNFNSPVFVMSGDDDVNSVIKKFQNVFCLGKPFDMKKIENHYKSFPKAA